MGTTSVLHLSYKMKIFIKIKSKLKVCLKISTDTNWIPPALKRAQQKSYTVFGIPLFARFGCTNVGAQCLQSIDRPPKGQIQSHVSVFKNPSLKHIFPLQQSSSSAWS